MSIDFGYVDPEQTEIKACDEISLEVLGTRHDELVTGIQFQKEVNFGTGITFLVIGLIGLLGGSIAAPLSPDHLQALLHQTEGFYMLLMAFLEPISSTSRSLLSLKILLSSKKHKARFV